MRFFSLIHICADEKSLHNNSFVKSFDDQINLYFSCAKQLHLSLKEVGIELIVLTNDKEFLKRLNTDQYNIQIIQLDFSLKVPSGIKFYSAHYKIEVYKYLSTLEDEYVALIDCDILCVNKIPECFLNIIEKQIPLYYDITDQVTPAYGARRIIDDKQRLSETKSIGLWAGGEFISGTPHFFSKLYKEVSAIEEKYFANFKLLQHQGDEMLTSVAIENMMMNTDTRILDAGALSIVIRYWSPKTLHVQKKVDAFADHFLLHLPSDKKFITRLSKDELKGEAFFSAYKRHLFISRAIEGAVNKIKPFIKRGVKKAAM